MAQRVLASQPVECGSRMGFSLLEALLSLLILTLAASVIGTVYYTGLKSYDIQGETIVFNSALRSKMEYLLSLNFDQVVSGSENVTIAGQSRTLSWTVTPVDMDADGVAEDTAKQISLSLQGLTLVMLLIDTAGQVSKL